MGNHRVRTAQMIRKPASARPKSVNTRADPGPLADSKNDGSLIPLPSNRGTGADMVLMRDLIQSNVTLIIQRLPKMSECRI